jgi:Zn ribbon nucleic-acid-binding protein
MQTANNDFVAGVKCPECRSRETVAHPSGDAPAADEADYGCEDCGLLFDEDSDVGSTVVVSLSGKQPDMVREEVVSAHVEHDVVADEDLAEEKLNIEEGDVVNIVHIVYASGTDGRIVSENARIKSFGPVE